MRLFHIFVYIYMLKPTPFLHDDINCGCQLAISRRLTNCNRSSNRLADRRERSHPFPYFFISDLISLKHNRFKHAFCV